MKKNPILFHEKKGFIYRTKKKEEKEIQQYFFTIIFTFIKNKMLYLFVIVYENGKSLVKSAVVGIEEFRNFEDLLKEVLHQKELFLEGKLVKVDFQCNNSSVWHSILNGLDEGLEACSQLKAQHVRFTIDSIVNNSDELFNERVSAFDLMMVQQHLKKLPPPCNTQFRTDVLYNDFLKVLQERKLGWLNNSHMTIGHSLFIELLI